MITLQNALRDDKDRIEIYVPLTKKFVLLPPIDARLLVEKGTGILNWVVVKNAKGEESVVSIENVTDADTVIRSAQFRDAKTQVITNIFQPRIAIASVGNDGVDFAQYTVVELKTFAELAQIPDFATMKKADLIAALTEKKFDPESVGGGDNGKQ